MDARILIALFCAWIASETIKFLLNKDKSIKGLFYSVLQGGGFPSSHIAFVSALAFSMIFSEGFSNLSLVTLALLAIIFTDAVGVRHKVGTLYQIAYNEKKVPHPGREGHTWEQAIAGLVLGALITAIIFSI